MNTRFVSAIVTLGLLATSIVGAPTANAGPKECSQVTQPQMSEPTLGEFGATFTWYGGDAPFGSVYRLSTASKINGIWSWGPYFSVGESLHEYTVNWKNNAGVMAEALALLVLAYCVNAQNAPTKWAYYSDYQKLVDAEAAKVAAANQAAINAEVAKQVAAQQQARPQSTKKRVECVNKKTDEIKIFARKKCPKGWKRY